MVGPNFRSGWVQTVTDNDAAFLKELGRRMAQLRKEQGLTQAQLAELVGISQQLVASYEVGRRRIPAPKLPAVAHALAVSVEELLGTKKGMGKRGPSPKLQRQVELIRRLPRAKQRFVMEMLDTVLQQASR
jgi:transcriptional regulator with XRE-family HTH domain